MLATAANARLICSHDLNLLLELTYNGNREDLDLFRDDLMTPEKHRAMRIILVSKDEPTQCELEH